LRIFIEVCEVRNLFILFFYRCLFKYNPVPLFPFFEFFFPGFCHIIHGLLVFIHIFNKFTKVINSQLFEINGASLGHLY